jgi:Origin of replication binding protein
MTKKSSVRSKTVIVLTEHFNAENLAWLLDHPDYVARQRQNARDERRSLMTKTSAGVYDRLKMYRSKSQDSSVLVHYDFARQRTSGRRMAKGPSMQGLPHWVRAFLTPETGVSEYDISNCSPSLIAQLCKRSAIACPILDYYNEHRKECLALFDKSEGKKSVLSVLCGGKKSSQHPWLRTLVQEFKRISRELAAVHTDVFKVVKHEVNAHGKFMSRLVQIYEDQCLMAMREYTERVSQVRTLIFDGLIADDSGTDLSEPMSQHVQQSTGFALRIVKKPMESIDLAAISAAEAQRELDMFASGESVFDEPDSVSPPPVDTSRVYLPNNMFNDIPDKFISCCAGMMMGKTERTIELVEAYIKQHKSVLIITPRKSLAYSSKERMGLGHDALLDYFCEKNEEAQCKFRERNGMQPLTEAELKTAWVQHRSSLEGFRFAHYKDDVRGGVIDSEKHKCVIVEYESLNRIKGTFALIVADEWRSIVDTIQSQTNGLKTVSHWGQFKHLTHRAEKVLFLDADMTFDGAAYKVQEMLAQYDADMAADVLRQAAKELERTRCAQPTQVTELVMEAFRVSNNPVPIHRIVDKTHKMQRTVIPNSGLSNLKTASELLARGERLVLCCASKSAANMYTKYLKDYCQGEIGLYTSESGNGEDLKTLQKAWDRYQCIILTSTVTVGADYNSAVHSVFVFPYRQSCKPRDMSQMVGRARKVTTGNIYLANDSYDNAEVASRAQLDADFEAELERMHTCGSQLSTVLQQCAVDLRFTLPQELLVRSYRPSPPELLTIGAYAKVEQSYTHSMQK